MFKGLLSFITILFIFLSPTYSQKIGVVMSGGGAKGLYHIGVLKALEENSIPIDYVAGTSMGAIVGSFYAAGYSPEEIAELATSGQFKEWMSAKIDNNYGSYFRERNQFLRDDPMLSIRINTKERKIHLPRGLIPSIQIDMALSSYLAPAGVACEGDFDKLMVPFLCVASDISSNRQEVIFRNGDLPKAVRASMALPVAFKPIKEGDMILYDGGITDNFPWQPMLNEFNPDFMVGISCSSEEVKTDNISMMDNIFMLTMNHTSYDMPSEKSIHINRDVNASTLDFSSAKEIIEQGYEDAIKNMDSIKIRTSRRTSPEEFAARRKAFRAASPELIFDNYKIEGLDSAQMQYVYRYMATNRRNNSSQQREMSFDELKTNLYSILSANDFSTEFPKIGFDDKSQRYSFQIELNNKPSLKLALGGNLSSTPFNQIYLSASYTAIGLTAKTAYVEAYLGPVYNVGIFGGRIDLYRRSPLFLDTYVNLSSKNLSHGNFGNLTDVSNSMSIKSSDNYISIGMGTPISKRTMFSARANLGREMFKYDDQSPNLSVINTTDYIDETKLRYSAVKGEIERITFDRSLFPTKGSKLNISAIFLHAKEDNSRSDNYNTSGFEAIPSVTHMWYGARLRYDKYITSARSSAWFSMGINIDGVYSTVDPLVTNIASIFALPAYQPTLHSKMVFMPEYYAKSYAAGGVIPQFMIIKNFYIQCGIYTMFRDRYVDKNGEVLFPIGSDYCMQFISDLSLIYHTRMGPVSVALTKYNISNSDNLYLTFNIGYSIFAPKGRFY